MKWQDLISEQLFGSTEFWTYCGWWARGFCCCLRSWYASFLNLRLQMPPTCDQCLWFVALGLRIPLQLTLFNISRHAYANIVWCKWSIIIAAAFFWCLILWKFIYSGYCNWYISISQKCRWNFAVWYVYSTLDDICSKSPTVLFGLLNEIATNKQSKFRIQHMPVSRAIN